MTRRALFLLPPWLDLRFPPKDVKLPEVEKRTDRRFVKTHLPVDALVFSPKAKYIYIGRDGRDVVWSMYNHHANANELSYQALNDAPCLGSVLGYSQTLSRAYWRVRFAMGSEQRDRARGQLTG
jgi:aryl sulfotransferase